MAESNQFLKTVESIYAAGVDNEQWQGALVAVAQLFGSLGATLEIFEKEPARLIDFHMTGLPPVAEAQYLAHYAAHNPRAEYAFRNFSEVTLCDYQLIDEPSMDRSAYYAKYLHSLDLRYFLSGQVVNTPTIQGVVTIQRSRRQGHVDRRDIELMRRLLPHVGRAYDLATRLKSAQSQTDSFQEALDWLDDGVALLGKGGQVLHANETLIRLARLSSGEIRLTARGLEFAASDACARLAKSLSVALRARDGGEPSARDFAVERKSGMPAYQVSVRPTAPTDTIGLAGACVAIVFIRDPLGRDRSAFASLQETLRLTDAEAALAAALLAGISPTEYSRSRGVSANTVYTHLRRIKEKARGAHLPELIRRLYDAMPAVRRHLPH